MRPFCSLAGAGGSINAVPTCLRGMLVPYLHKGEPVSILKNLKQRREELAGSLLLPISVPRWEDPAIVLQCAPLSHHEIRRGAVQVEKAKDKAAAEVNSLADVVIRSTKRIDVENESFPGFGAELAEALELDPESSARELVKALFFTEGDIMMVGSAVVEFSGYRNADTGAELGN